MGTKGSDYQGDTNFSSTMKSFPNLFRTTLKSEDKRAAFDPISMLNVGKSVSIQTRGRRDSRVLSSRRRVGDGWEVPWGAG